MKMETNLSRFILVVISVYYGYPPQSFLTLKVGLKSVVNMEIFPTYI
jgi:hypothetical protein